jgi:hypothetical protein
MASDALNFCHQLLLLQGLVFIFFMKCDCEFPDLLAINPKGVWPLATSPPLPFQPKQKNMNLESYVKTKYKGWWPNATLFILLVFFIHCYIHRHSPFIIIAEQLIGRHHPRVASRDSNSGPPYPKLSHAAP